SRLERIGTEVEQLRETQRDERILPYGEAFAALLLEHDFPVVVTQPHQRAVIVPVEELLAWVLSLARQSIGDVVAVEVNLGGLFPDLHTLHQLLFDIGDTRRG